MNQCMVSNQSGHDCSQQSKRDDPSFFKYTGNYNKENDTGDIDDGEDFEDEEDDEEDDKNEEFMDASDQYPPSLNQPQLNRYQGINLPFSQHQ